MVFQALCHRALCANYCASVDSPLNVHLSNISTCCTLPEAALALPRLSVQLCWWTVPRPPSRIVSAGRACLPWAAGEASLHEGVQDFDLPSERLDLLACVRRRHGLRAAEGGRRFPRRQCRGAARQPLLRDGIADAAVAHRNFAVRWERLHLIKSASSSLALMRPWSRRKMRVCSSGVSVVPGAAYTASASLIRQPRLILTVAKTCASAHLM